MDRDDLRSAFTIIELVFVIMIIGILAVVAIPRLAATRDDAILATKAHNIAIATTEIAGYAISKGQTTSDLSQMSNAILLMKNTNSVTLEPHEAKVKVDTVQDCIIIQIDNPGSNTEILKLSYGTSSNPDCDKMRSLIDMNTYPIPLHGQIVTD